MHTTTEIRALVDQVKSFPPEERERIYRKYFAAPSNTVKFLCEKYQFDQRRILDATCHYGYYLAYFGSNSCGLDGSPQYLQFAREMGLDVQVANVEEPLPHFAELFDGILFSGTLEEILSPHVILMRFRSLLKSDGLLCLRVPTVPPYWFERIMPRRMLKGYAAQAHLYFFTPRILEMMLQRAGYDVVQVASTGVMMNPRLRLFHSLLLPLTSTVTTLARPRPNFKYPTIRAMRFLPTWASDLAVYHTDYPGHKPNA